MLYPHGLFQQSAHLVGPTYLQMGKEKWEKWEESHII